ncbi:uncharacterized protein EI90DRAFT_2316676 [Cantharellus anzutake]|uniref:uncharacterized protein n=1 Tax=Cantharellus anzutake TaxID=1750568 RepID=UPI001908E668|nr:uncharacterized protein EI90DRAFT_2316676 [Cantharellus anzutake]KAF8340004.1 hypothetical protein EI90DRAFT_2316676 [Cantharellus anzutake]
MEQHQDTATSNYFTNNDSSNQHALPSFAVETAVPFDFDEWSKKAANAEYPYTPSYASYNSPGSNLSGLSAPLDSADDDFEFMHHTKVGSYGEDLVGLGIHNLGDEDEGYNPHHFSSIAPGAEEFPLIEDQFGNTFVYDAPSNASSPPPHINEPTAYYRPSPDHSPGSSVGDIENPTKSRASSVSSFHRSPRTQSTAPPGFNESLAGLNFGVTSGAESPELHAHRVASPGIISAPIDAPSPPPSSTSPPAPHHAHTKSLTQPLVIPASPSLHPFNSLHNNEHEGESQETAKVVDNMATAAAFSTAFLQPPHDPTFALPRFPVQDSAADNEGPAIRLIPSTPITAGGSVARGVMRPSPLSFVPEDTGANESTFPPPQPDNGSVDPAASWNTQVVSRLFFDALTCLIGTIFIFSSFLECSAIYGLSSSGV